MARPEDQPQHHGGVVDNNNNNNVTHNEVYSITSDNNNNNSDHDDGRKGVEDEGCEAAAAKYQLRPRSMHPRRHCDTTEWHFQDSIRNKPRPAPLSRYRRKTANARERYRMRQINSAFESLRGVLPSWVCSRRAASDMTKIATLRLASAYIRSLQDILDGNAPQDTCSWVLSSILQDTRPRQELSHGAKMQFMPQHAHSDAELVTLLCGSDAQAFHDDLDVTCLSPGSQGDAVTLLLLEPDTHRVWAPHHSPMVS